jgi:hypothetical protein
MSLNDKWKEILEKYNIRNQHSEEVNYSVVDWISDLEMRVSVLQEDNIRLKHDVKVLQDRLSKSDEPLL